MAIITNNPTGNPMQLCCIACAEDIPFIQLPDVIRSIDFCPCDYVCDYEEPVFGYLPDIGDEYKNDKSSFIGKKTDASAFIEATIKQLDTGQDFLVTDNTYGTFFPAGTVPDRPLYIAFIADWGKILNTLGAGLYQIEFKETVFGEEYFQDTVKYRLENFTDIRANKTVKFEFIQNGIKENGLDYRGLNFSYQFRLKGTFGNKQVVFETDTYLTENRKVSQIQDKTKFSYEFTSGLVDATVLNSIWDIGINANTILVTDYNVLNSERFENVSVVVSDSPEISHYVGNNNPLVNCKIPFEDRVQDNVKRNV
jgi:hypothetical protein